MDKKQITPSKQSKILTTATSNYLNQARQSFRSNSQLSIAREYEHLKSQFRHLEIQNRQLTIQVEKLKYEKSLQESKLIQKNNFQQQTLNQYQKEKNYQIQMLRLKNEEEIARVKRQYQLKLEDIQRQIRIREVTNKELGQKNSSLDVRTNDLKKNIENLQGDLIKFRNNNSVLSEQLTKEQFANKKLEMLIEEVQNQKKEMQNQIHLLLDIEAEKSAIIQALQHQLNLSLAQEKNLSEKSVKMTDGFANLEIEINNLKSKLKNSQQRGEDQLIKIRQTNDIIRQKELLISQQKNRIIELRDEISNHKERQYARLQEIQELMSDNQRVYHQLVFTKHQLYEVSISQGIDI